MQTDFERDLIRGDIGQNLVIGVLEAVGLPTTLNASTDRKTMAEHDLTFIYNNQPLTIEVKYDEMSQETGNVAIEYYNPRLRQSSGIQATRADLWVHVLSDTDIRITSVELLKKFIEVVRPTRYVRWGGDNNSNMAIYPKEKALKVLTPFNTQNAIQSIKQLTTPACIELWKKHIDKFVALNT